MCHWCRNFQGQRSFRSGEEKNVGARGYFDDFAVALAGVVLEVRGPILRCI